MQPIFIVTGAPAAGKSTLARAILSHFELGLWIPVDDLREWVTSGISHPIPWTDETTRQFSLAENAAADVAIRYQDAGFAVVIDHCQNPAVLRALCQERFGDRAVYMVILAPDLLTNLTRNRTRTGKSFDPEVLVPSIEALNPLYSAVRGSEPDWFVLNNDEADPAESARRLLAELGVVPGRVPKPKAEAE